MAVSSVAKLTKQQIEQIDGISLELIRANDLLELATDRASNFSSDSALQTLLAAIEDRLRAIAQHVGIDRVKDLGIGATP